MKIDKNHIINKKTQKESKKPLKRYKSARLQH